VTTAKGDDQCNYLPGPEVLTSCIALASAEAMLDGSGGVA